MERLNRQASLRSVASGVSAVIFLFGLSQSVTAELQEIGDAELSSVTGQAMLAFDVAEGENSTQTRFTIGSKIDTQINFKEVMAGQYENLEALTDADVRIPKMSLGHISRDTGNIVPFTAENPYFEIAESNGELVGFRMGFENAKGTLSGDFDSFSGDIGMKVIDEKGIENDTFLLDANNNQTNNRATHIGVIIVPEPVVQPEDYEEQSPTPGPPPTVDPTFPDDPQMQADLAPPPLPELPPRLIVNKLTEFKTLEVGDPDTAEAAKDFFFSFQKEEVIWQSKGGGDPVTAGAGVHFNIPTAMKLTIPQFQAGIPRSRTEFIDRGQGLF